MEKYSSIIIKSMPTKPSIRHHLTLVTMAITEKIYKE